MGIQKRTNFFEKIPKVAKNISHNAGHVLHDVEDSIKRQFDQVIIEEQNFVDRITEGIKHLEEES
jgi:hypothetical protein